MPFVIGAGTIITGFGDGIQSINLSLNPQIQRLYQLGSIIPFDKNIINQFQLNITRYAPGAQIDVTASESCEEPEPLEISIAATSCAGEAVDISEDWFVTSYSYSKDVQSWGTESYSMVTRPEVIGGDGAEVRMIRGVAEGQTSTDGGANTGVLFIIGSTQVEGRTIEVAAGTPGIGLSLLVDFGEVAKIAGTSTAKADGRVGNASVNIPYTPIFIPI